MGLCPRPDVGGGAATGELSPARRFLCGWVACSSSVSFCCAGVVVAMRWMVYLGRGSDPWALHLLTSSAPTSSSICLSHPTPSCSPMPSVTGPSSTIASFGCADKPAEKHCRLIYCGRKILFRLKKQTEKDRL
jgi:hypothetical protein